jgi:hypothetical protein
MRRLVNHARAIATVERDATEATDTRYRHEVQGKIVATGSVVPSLGMPRARPTGRRPKLAEQRKKRSTETGLDKDSGETGEGNEFGSVSLAGAWRANRGSHERTRSAMGKPSGLELAIRRKLPSLFRGGRSLIYGPTVPPRAFADCSITSRITTA